MKFAFAIILIASVASSTHAAGNLRSGANTQSINESEQPGSPDKGVLLMKEQPNNRNLQGGNDRMQNVLAAEWGTAGDLQAEEQERAQATREKLLGEMTTTAADTPLFELTPKDEPTEPVPTEPYSEADFNNTDFGVRIVGGEVSDPNEFPYYGTSFFRHPISKRTPYLEDESLFLTWTVSCSQLT
jgi:hypothetical protein